MGSLWEQLKVPHQEASLIITQEQSWKHTHTHIHPTATLAAAVCGCVMWVLVCDLRCTRVRCGWHPRWLLHGKQDFSGSRWLKKTAHELMAEQKLEAGGVCYNWPTPLSTSTVSPSLLSARRGYSFICTFSVCDLPLLCLRINKSIRG